MKLYKMHFLISCIVNIISLLVLGVAATQASLFGVDPNSLQCDPLGQKFLLLPHFSDCNKFFMCAHGEEVEMSCSSPELVFDFALQTCNWPWATECVLRSSKDSKSSEEEEPQDSGEEPQESKEETKEPAGSEEDLEDSSEGSGEGSGDFEWADSWSAAEAVAPVKVIQDLKAGLGTFNNLPDCSNPATAVRSMPYRGDCQRYWRCVSGLPQTFYCSDGLFYNDKSMQCDFEANVSCDVNHEYELDGEFLVYN